MENLAHGDLSVKRWQSYQKLKAESFYAEYKEDYLAAKEQRHKEISRLIKKITNPNKRYKGAVDMITIRNEEERDYMVVEKITRKAFYNLYVPGCAEHYLVHTMRGHEDFISELDFVIELDGQVIGNIMYTKARLVDEAGTEKEILTFGPVSIDPEHQRQGYGRMLIEHSFEQAIKLGYDVVVILGSPMNYVGRGFKSCRKLNVCMENGKYPAAMMVKELIPHRLDGRKWFYYDSPVMAISEEEAQKYDDTLEKMEKKHQPSHEEFYIMSHAFIDDGDSCAQLASDR